MTKKSVLLAMQELVKHYHQKVAKKNTELLEEYRERHPTVGEQRLKIEEDSNLNSTKKLLSFLELLLSSIAINEFSLSYFLKLQKEVTQLLNNTYRNDTMLTNNQCLEQSTARPSNLNDYINSYTGVTLNTRS